MKRVGRWLKMVYYFSRYVGRKPYPEPDCWRTSVRDAWYIAGLIVDAHKLTVGRQERT